MKFRILNLLTLLLAVILSAAAQNGYQLFQQGLAKERAESDLRGAVQIYERVVRQSSNDRKLAAQALYRIGECQRALGNTEARKAYERIVRDFADQKEQVAEAQARLVAMGANQNPGVAEMAFRKIWAGRGVNGRGRPSPDGKYLTFVDNETGDVAVRELISGVIRRLTNTGDWYDYAGRSVISPDSTQIAYTWEINNDGPWRSEVRLVPLESTEIASPKTIYRAGKGEYVSPFGWTPDGKELLIVRSLEDRTRQIAMLSIADGSVRVIRSLGSDDQPNPSLSPDGRFIAYERPANNAELSHDVFVLTADGTGETPITSNPARDTSPIWSPDGTQLLFMSLRTGNPSLWRIQITSGKPAGEAQLVKADLGEIVPIGMTQKGTFIYGIPGSTRRNIYSLKFDSELNALEEPNLAIDSFLNSNRGPAWSPDGESLAYYSTKTDSIVLRVRSFKTGEDRHLPVNLELVSLFGAGPIWFPDGRSFLVLARMNGNRSRGFYRVDSSTGKSELLHSVDNRTMSSYRLSPDGKSIYYCFQGVEDADPNKFATGQILRFDIGGEKPVVLAEDRWFISIALSPEGKQIAFLESHQRPKGVKKTTSSISVAPVDALPGHEIFRSSEWGGGSRYNGMAWSTDGRYIVFVREAADQQGHALWRIPASGGTPEQIAEGSILINNPGFHPDGRQIVFAASESGAGEIWALENFLPAQTAAK